MFLGIDTSNYTTSVALYDGKSIVQKKKMLTVKNGEKGLRQSEAVFQHVINMPELLKELELNDVTAVGVSVTPRSVEGSYMPCFKVGELTAQSISSALNIPLYKTSHQTGHILAALYSANRLDLIDSEHVAFHLSGGTTEGLIVKPDNSEIIKAEIVSSSLDLKAGQAIDRAGVMLGLDFPCGKMLDKLSCKSDTEFKYKPSMIGMDCSMSGVENKAKKLLDEGCSAEDISKFVLTCVSNTVVSMLSQIINKYGELPVIFSGGVSSNTLLRKKVKEKYSNVHFAEPEFSLDNAAGCAIYAYMKDR